MYDRVPGAETDENHMNMERFLLACDHRRMAPDEFVLDYFRTKNDVRVNRRMTLVKVPVDEARRVQASCRTVA